MVLVSICGLAACGAGDDDARDSPTTTTAPGAPGGSVSSTATIGADDTVVDPTVATPSTAPPGAAPDTTAAPTTTTSTPPDPSVRPETPDATAVLFVWGVLTGADVTALGEPGLVALTRDRIGPGPDGDPQVQLGPDGCTDELGGVTCDVSYASAAGTSTVAITLTVLPPDAVPADDGVTWVMPDGSPPPAVLPYVTGVEPVT